MNRRQHEDLVALMDKLLQKMENIDKLLKLFECENCAASGWIDTEDRMETCTHCNGEGYTRKVGAQ